MQFSVERLGNIKGKRLIARSVLELNFNSGFFRPPFKFVKIRIRRGREAAGLQVIVCPGCGCINHYGVLVRHVFDKTGHWAEPIVAAFLAVFPNLFNSALLLINLVDHRARVLHIRKGRLIKSTSVAVIEDGNVDLVLRRLRINTPSGVLCPRPIEIRLFTGCIAALQFIAVCIYRRKKCVAPRLLPAA